MRNLAIRAAVRVRDATLRYREYSIGVLTGPSPLLLSAPVANPVLTRRDVTDVDASFVADPFVLWADGTYHLFFEALVRSTGRGEIAHATSADGLRWRYGGIVLREPFHLSYPYVFRDGSEIYMIPETSQAKSVRLYRADPFPSRWTLVTTLLTGPVFTDSSVFQHDGRWWMFTQTALHSRHDTLRLFHADEITGPWREHPRSPIVRGDARIARPAGRILTLPSGIVRFAQDCRGDYGRRVHALRVQRLTPDDYAEAEWRANPLLSAGLVGWNRTGMHHIDAMPLPDGNGWLACVDGWAARLREP